LPIPFLNISSSIFFSSTLIVIMGELTLHRIRDARAATDLVGEKNLAEAGKINELEHYK
jgi:hypothetical protein